MAPTAGGLNLPDANRVVIGGPRARCDTRGRGQRCVWADFTPTITFAAARVPEIAAHPTSASGRTTRRASSGRPLERLTGPEVNRNRRATCPRQLVARVRGERRDGSRDEYPFASAPKARAGSSVADVPRAENNVQGGLLRSFYDRERILRKRRPLRDRRTLTSPVQPCTTWWRTSTGARACPVRRRGSSTLARSAPFTYGDSYVRLSAPPAQRPPRRGTCVRAERRGGVFPPNE